MRAILAMLTTAVLVAVGLTVSAAPASAVTMLSGTVTLGQPPRTAATSEVDVQVFRCTQAATGCTTAVLSGYTDASGVYRVYNLTEGFYSARARHTMSKFKTTTSYFAVTAEQPSPVLDIWMPVANVVSGVVTLGTDGPAGAGDVRVGVEGASARVTTDAAGRYALPDLQDGSYRLVFEYVGEGSYVDQWSGGVLRSADATPVSVTSDTNYGITLPRGGVLTGTVTQVAPSTTADLTVIAELYGIDPFESEVASDGSWRITGLPDGTYGLRAYDKRRGATMQYGESATSWGETVQVAGASTTAGLDIVMLTSTVLDGRVYCNGCRAGWSGGSAYVSLEALTPQGWKGSRASDLMHLPVADGAYYQVRPVYPGTYRLLLRSMEHTFRTVVGPTFEVTAGGVTGGPKDFTYVPTDPARDFDGDSMADVLAVDPAGALLLYRGNGAGRWGTKSTIGRGWGGFTAVFSPGDFSGDGNADVLARDSAGLLWMYRGNGSGGWTGGKVQVGRGWQGFTALFSPGDFDGDGNNDVLARDASGKLVLYRGNGSGGWLGSRVVGTGWQGFAQIVGPGNFDGDQVGTADVLAQLPNGDLYLYRGSGAGGFSGSKVLLGRGLTEYGTLIPVGDFDRQNGVDLMARTGSGALYLLPTDGMGHINAWKLIGSGWNALKLVR